MRTLWSIHTDIVVRTRWSIHPDIVAKVLTRAARAPVRVVDVSLPAAGSGDRWHQSNLAVGRLLTAFSLADQGMKASTHSLFFSDSSEQEMINKQAKAEIITVLISVTSFPWEP